MCSLGRHRVSETYAVSLHRFLRFLPQDDIPLCHIDATLMQSFEYHLIAEGLTPNTISFYMRNLRALYNRAVEQGRVRQKFPFRHVYTGVDKTMKRAVPARLVSRLRAIDLSLQPDLAYARDMFLFSFYTRGMSFVDMAFLRKSDLKDGMLIYRRKKTGQQLIIKWERPMQQIVERYASPTSPYLLPIIRCPGYGERRQYQSMAHYVNVKLRLLGQQLSFPLPLTMYVARHSWATMARSKNVPLSTISQAMGHNSEHTTRIYLSLLDTSQVDKANRLILQSL